MSHVHIRRLAQIRREFETVRAALSHVIARWPDPATPGELKDFSLKDFRSTAENLEITYFIRLFSQFEAILRDFLRHERRRVPRVTETLIDRAATMRRIEAATLARVHDVRQYRNALVHEGATAIPPIAFEDALAALNRFLVWLP